MKWVLMVVVISGAVTGGYYFGARQHDGHNHGGETVLEKALQLWTCGMHPFIIRDEPGLCPICHMDLTPVKAGTGGGGSAAAGPSKWRSPMDPTYIRDEPGKDYMGHDLVPVSEGGGDDNSISIDPVTTQNMGIRSEAVTRRTLARTLRTVGLIAYEEGRKYSVNSKIEGWIETLHINREGQEVKKGQPLLALYSPELVAAQEEYLLALRNSKRLAGNPLPEVAESSMRLLAAARTRLQYWDISEAQIEALKASGQPSKTLTLYSRHNGVVIMKKALEGMRVMAGEELLQIADISRIWVNAEIFEYQLPSVVVGQEAEIELPFAAGTVHRGKITHIYPYLNNETRTAVARIELDNPGLVFKPDMYATIRIRSGAVEALAIPSDAVLNSGTAQTVFVAQGGGRFAPRQVTLGVSGEDGFVQVLSGLEEGEQVVVSAQFMLDSESSLREALRKMMGPVSPEAPAAAAGDNLDDLFQ
jgi:RND family efflux transporter MFP subunit